MVLASNLLANYNRTRHELYNRIGNYYRQSIASDYIKEDVLIEMLEKCKKSKESYIRVRDILISRGAETLPDGSFKMDPEKDLLSVIFRD